MASSRGSHKRKSKAPADQTQALRDESHETKFHKITSRKCVPGRSVDMNFLRTYFQEVYECLLFQGLITLLSLHEDYYPNLMYVAYSGLFVRRAYKELGIYVKGKEARISHSLIEDLVDLPCDGEFVVDTGVSSRTASYRRSDAMQMMCTNPSSSVIGKVKTSDLKTEMRVLHHIIVHSIYPKSGSFAEVGSFELLLMWLIMTRQKVCFSTMIISKMASVIDSDKGLLHYGMIFSRIFRYFDVISDGDSSLSLTPSDILDERTMNRMGFFRIGMVWHSKGSKPSSSTFSEEEEPQPVSMQVDYGASTSSAHASLEDIMTELRYLRTSVDEMHLGMTTFDSRFTRMEEQVADFHYDMREQMSDFRAELKDIRKQLESEEESESSSDGDGDD